MGRKWDKDHPVKKKRLSFAWRKRHPKYMSDYGKLLRLYVRGKIKLQFGERLMDYRWKLKGVKK